MFIRIVVIVVVSVFSFLVASPAIAKEKADRLEKLENGREHQNIPVAVRNLSVKPEIHNVRMIPCSNNGDITCRAVLTWSGGREGYFELYVQWIDVEKQATTKTIPIKQVVCGEVYVHGMEVVNIREGERVKPALQLYFNGEPLMAMVLDSVGEYRVVR